MTELLRTAGSGAIEELRSAANTAGESLRAPAGGHVEELHTMYDMAHPVVAGCTLMSRQAVAGLARAGCAIPGLDEGYR